MLAKTWQIYTHMIDSASVFCRPSNSKRSKKSNPILKAPNKTKQTNAKPKTANQSTRWTSSPQHDIGSMRSSNFTRAARFANLLHVNLCSTKESAPRVCLTYANYTMFFILKNHLIWRYKKKAQATKKETNDTSSIWCESVGIPKSHSSSSSLVHHDSWFEKQTLLKCLLLQKIWVVLGDVDCYVASQLHSTYIFSNTNNFCDGVDKIRAEGHDDINEIVDVQSWPSTGTIAARKRQQWDWPDSSP